MAVVELSLAVSALNSFTKEGEKEVIGDVQGLSIRGAVRQSQDGDA